MSFTENSLEFGKKHLSYSKLKMGSKCGFQYKHRYLDRTEVDAGSEQANAIVGTFIHAVIEKTLMHYIENTNEPYERDDVSKIITAKFASCYDEKPLTSQEGDAALNLKSSTEFMTRRILTYAKKTDSIMYLEKELAFDENFKPVGFHDDSAFFRGAIDVILVDKRGKALVLDHKTGYRNTSAYDTQLNSYAMLVAKALAPEVKEKENLEITSIQTGINFVEAEDLYWKDTQSIGMVNSLTEEWFLDWVNTTSENIALGKVKRGSHCKHCQYKSQCGSRVGKMGKKTKKKPMIGTSVAL